MSAMSRLDAEMNLLAEYLDEPRNANGPAAAGTARDHEFAFHSEGTSNMMTDTSDISQPTIVQFDGWRYEVIYVGSIEPDTPGWLAIDLDTGLDIGTISVEFWRSMEDYPEQMWRLAPQIHEGMFTVDEFDRLVTAIRHAQGLAHYLNRDIEGWRLMLEQCVTAELERWKAGH